MRAEFVRAYASAQQLAPSELCEVAVAGRSNCGKSSLINALTGHKALARTSSTPGRTQQIIFFRLEQPGAPPYHLVDLPGYGFAKVARNVQTGWAQLIERYITTSSGLKLLLLLQDLRRDPGDEELSLLQWCRELCLPVLVVLTKSDKLAKSRRAPLASRIKAHLQLTQSPLLFSVHDRQAVQVLRAQVAQRVIAAAQ